MSQQIIFNIVFFVIGSCFGSFLSVLIYRFQNSKKGIIAGKSFCPHCKHRLGVADLIPLLSWIFKAGRCSYCHKSISPLYPTMELASALLFITNFNLLVSQQGLLDWTLEGSNWFFWLKMIYYNLLMLCLLAICFADLQKKTIPNLFLYIWIALTLPALLINGNALANLGGYLLALLAALLFFGGQYFLSGGRWLGSGDIYLAVGMALLLGLNNFILAVVCSYLIGSIIVVLLLLLKKAKTKQTIPFAPFLVMGTLIAFYQGDEIINWYLSNFLTLNFF